MTTYSPTISQKKMVDLVATTLKSSIKQIESDAGVKFIKMNRYPIANSIFVDGFDNYVIFALSPSPEDNCIRPYGHKFNFEISEQVNVFQISDILYKIVNNFEATIYKYIADKSVAEKLNLKRNLKAIL